MPTKRPRKVAAKPSSRRGSTEARQRRFVDAYFAHNENVSAAMRSLGYSPHTVGAQGSRMLKDVKIQEMIKKRREELAQKTALTAEEVIASLARAVRFDPRLLYDKNGRLKKITELPDEVALELEGIDISPKKMKLDFPKKHAARDQAMRFFGLFAKDKQGFNPEDDGTTPPPISVTVNYKDARRRKG